MTDPERNPGSSRRAVWLLLPLALVGAGICGWSLFANVTLGEAESFIAAPLHSVALANYAQDPIGGRLQSLSIRIIEFAIQDREPETDDAGARATEVVESLKSPVPTVTPKPGDPTYTPTPLSTAVPSATIGTTGTPAPTPSPTRTPTRTPSATPTDLPTAGPSPTPTKTPTPGPSSTATKTPTASNTPGPSNTPTPCKVPPYIEIVSPIEDQHFTLTQELPGEAFAFDPDNANPATCATSPPGSNGQGIPLTATPTPAVEFIIERQVGVSWVQVHYQAQNTPAYCAFTGSVVCLTHDLGSGEWPDTTPINTGLHRMKARVKRDDEGVASEWVSVNFYIDPVSTATPTPSNTPTPSSTPSPTPDVCSMISLNSFNPSSTTVRWKIDNSTGGNVTLTQIELNWPTANGNLNSIQFEGSTIWTGSDAPPSITVGTSQSVGSGVPDEEVKFIYGVDAQSTGYVLVLTFNSTCTVTFDNS